MAQHTRAVPSLLLLLSMVAACGQMQEDSGEQTGPGDAPFEQGEGGVSETMADPVDASSVDPGTVVADEGAGAGTATRGAPGDTAGVQR